LLYVLLAFPLGLFYFIFFVVGFSLGVPLMILWVGFLILALVFAGWWAFILFERQQAITLLRVDLPPVWQEGVQAKTTWEKIKSYAANPVTWLGLLFLLLKFPVGIACFVVVVTLFATTAAFVTAPLTYSFFPVQIDFDWNVLWQIDTFWEAIILFGIGLLIGLAGLHLINALAWGLSQLARLMLGDPRRLAPETIPTREAVVPMAGDESDSDSVEKSPSQPEI